MSVTKPHIGRLPSGLVPDKLEAMRVFHEAEIPVLYTTQTIQGQDLLAYVADLNDEGAFTLLVPVAQETLAGLENGSKTIYQALSSSPPWLHWTDGVKSDVWAYSLSDLPIGHLPESSLPLHSELEPIFRTRAVGEEIVLGRIPASAVGFVADATRKALKTVLDYILEVKSEGRPSNEHRTLYDLPIQSFAFASFELSFAAPDEGVFSRDEVKEATAKLESGLLWAARSHDTTGPSQVAAENEAILKAVYLLTPPSTGPIKEVHLSGAWLGNQGLVLTRSSRRKVLQALRDRDVEDEIPVVYEGRLGELDTDKFTFTLRDTNDGQERRGNYEEEIADEMMELLSQRVLVAGVQRGGSFTAVVVFLNRHADSGPKSEALPSDGSST